MSAEIIHVRNSERASADRCPQQWQWSWREGLRPKETAKALWFGTGIHLALAHYYKPGKKRGKDMVDVWRAFANEEAEYMRIRDILDEEQYVEARDLGEAMLLGYMQEYQGDKQWNVIAPEQTFEVRIPYRFPGAMPKSMRKYLLNEYGEFFILNGTFDGVYFDESDKRTKLMEHKTAASISVGHLPMDNQGGTYWAVAYTTGLSQGWLRKNQQIKQITYNFLRKAMPDDRPKDAQGYATNKPLKAHYLEALPDVIQRGKTIADLEFIAKERGIVVLGDRSKVQPPPLFERYPVTRTLNERRTQIERIQAEVVKMLLWREGILEITKATDRNHCNWCPFKEMCELHERKSDWAEFRDGLFYVQDPYQDHRKSASAA